MSRGKEDRGADPHGPSDQNPSEPPGSPRWFFVHAVAFVVLLSLWTWKLLEPYPVPEGLREGLAAAGLSFVAAKSLHAGGYAFLTVLAATLPVPRRWRYFLVGLLALHGAATEVGQTFVPNRTGRAYDVLIDWCGIAAGLLVLRVTRSRRDRV